MVATLIAGEGVAAAASVTVATFKARKGVAAAVSVAVAAGIPDEGVMVSCIGISGTPSEKGVPLSASLLPSIQAIEGIIKAFNAIKHDSVCLVER